MPYTTLPLTLVDGLAYNAATPQGKRDLLPAEPGVYIWSLQLARLLRGIAHGDELPSRVTTAFEHLRVGRMDQGLAGRFKRVQVLDEPPVLTSVSARRLHALLPAGHAQFDWLLTAATVFQRPLYVGKAINFRNRLPDHFGYKTSFAKELRDFGMNLNDCAVTLVRLSLDGHEREADTGVVLDDEQDSANELAQDLTGQPFAASGTDYQDEGDADEGEREELIPVDRQDQDKMIRLAESLLIRNLQPFFNKQVE